MNYLKNYTTDRHMPCGTAHSIRKDMPSMISKMDVKPLQSLFVWNGPLLCLKWKGAKTKTKKKQLQF